MSWYNRFAWGLTMVAAGACSSEGPNLVSYDSTMQSNAPGSLTNSSPDDSNVDDATSGGSTNGGSTNGGSVSPGGNGGAATGGVTPSTTSAPDRPMASGGCAATTLTIDETGQVADSCSGIQGIWYCYEDGVNPTSCMDGSPPFTAGGMCLEGSTTVDPQYTAWGAGIGLTLNHPGGSGSKRAFDAEAADIVGFEITVTGELGGLELRIGYTVSTSESDVAPFVQKSRTGTHEILFADATISWEPSAPPVDPGRVFDVQVQVVGGEAAADYDFCVSEIAPIYAP